MAHRSKVLISLYAIELGANPFTNKFTARRAWLVIPGSYHRSPITNHQSPATKFERVMVFIDSLSWPPGVNDAARALW